MSTSRPSTLADDLPALLERLDRLEDLAAAAGAPAEWVGETVEAFVTVLAELGEHRAGDADPRVRRSLRKAERMAAAKAAGATTMQIAVRWNCSASQVRRLLQRRASHDARTSRYALRNGVAKTTEA